MKWSYVFRFWVASCLLLPSIGYAAGLQVLRTESTVGSVSLDVSLLRGPGEGIQFGAVDSTQKQGMSVSASPLPVNLRVLVDTSILCHKLKIDQQATDMLNLVKRTFPRESVISVVEFNSNGIEVRESQKSLSEWKGTTIACKGSALASSYEKALLTTYQKVDNSLPNVVWVLTSGNVGLSKESANLLKQSGSSLHLVLHNPILEKEIRPLADQTAAIVGRDQVQFGVLAPTAAPLLPEQRFRLSLTVPGTSTSPKALVDVTARRGAQVIATENVAVEMAVDPLRRFLAYAAIIGGILLGVGLVAYTIFRIVRYYRARYCGKCQRRMRFGHTTCLFCDGEGSAYLVGKFNWADRRKIDKQDLVPVSNSVTEIGTHRKSAVPLIAPAGKRREVLAKIIREGVAGYRLEASAGNTSIRVNGHSVKTRRYLASGDVLNIGGREITFLAKRSARNA